MRRNKPTSAREGLLTEDEAIKLRYWYFYERNVELKAMQLRISKRTLYRYVHRQHKPRKPSNLDQIADEMSLLGDVPRKVLGDECTQMGS